MELKIQDISKKFDDTIALNHLSMTLTPGVYGLLGANGSGKTTLFRIISGILQPTEGRIFYNQEDITKNNASFRCALGFLPQDFSYYPEFSGTDFMLYIASLKGLSKKTAKKRSEALLELVGLSEVKQKKIRKYSGGMKQRLGIAQAMLNDPEVLILDEPTVGLDPKERVRFRNLISSFSDEKIVILSTHIVSDVAYIADEILILKKGRLENRGTSGGLIEEVNGYVWECKVEAGEVETFNNRYSISNQKHDGAQTVLRIVAKEKPAYDAVQVAPNLEDLYLYYFQEGS